MCCLQLLKHRNDSVFFHHNKCRIIWLWMLMALRYNYYPFCVSVSPINPRYKPNDIWTAFQQRKILYPLDIIAINELVKLMLIDESELERSIKIWCIWYFQNWFSLIFFFDNLFNYCHFHSRKIVHLIIVKVEFKLWIKIPVYHRITSHRPKTHATYLWKCE